MNTRILELLQQPQLIIPEDLNLLEKQIQQEPYVQHIRALYLYGVHQYQPQRYKDVLTTTAAYTTDKKILYQFINQKNIKEQTAEKKSEITETIVPEARIDAVNMNKQVETDIEDIPETEILEKETISKTILDKDEIKSDDIINAPNPTDITLIDSSHDLTVKFDEKDEKEPLGENKDTVEEVIQTDSKETDGEVSFGGADNFLPDVKFSIPKNHNTFLNPPKFEKPKSKEIEIPDSILEIKKEVAGDDIIIEDEETSEVNFHHTADFGSVAPKEIIEDTVSIVSHTDNIVLIDDSQAWKPMSFDSNIPDALIGSVKTKVASKLSIEEEKDVTANETPKIEETIIVNKEEDSKGKEKNTDEARPIINVSFFSDALSIVSDNASDETIKKADTSDTITATESSISSIENDRKESVGNSNVNKFINTWQSWLKIDRSEEIIKTKEVQKHKAIEQFIENQPKISQLKDEVNFIVKEKKEDISHLMTETFANLYLEQKLYTKAINAFEILIKKHPEKSDYFQSRITDIKDMRKP